MGSLIAEAQRRVDRHGSSRVEERSDDGIRYFMHRDDPWRFRLDTHYRPWDYRYDPHWRYDRWQYRYDPQWRFDYWEDRLDPWWRYDQSWRYEGPWRYGTYWQYNPRYRAKPWPYDRFYRDDPFDNDVLRDDLRINPYYREPLRLDGRILHDDLRVY
jgi:hypothetical protein